MKKHRQIVLLALFFSLVALAVAVHEAAAAAAPKIDCPAKCLVRCGNNWKNKMCNKMCNACCNRCNCVPPGTTQDTRNLCPCYANMVNTKNGKPKCP